MMTKRLWYCGLVALLVAGGAQAADETPSNEEMWKVLQEQSQVIEEQQKQIEELNEKLEATGDAVEQVQAEAATGDGGTSEGGKWYDKTTIGGYGELHYNNLDNNLDGGDDKNEIDFHRFVLFFGHEFTDSIRFFSELEVEHALSGDDKPGEVELEQAYIEFDFAGNYGNRTGLMLVPVGILNETHEPPTFYGVERNPVEKNIIPSTWWEAGTQFTGHHENGLSWNLMASSGLKTDDYSIRGGRQKVAKADASDGAFTGRLAYRGVPGLEIAATAQYQTNITSDDLDKTPATLIETHVDYEIGGFGLRALYGRWDLDSDGAEAEGKDVQEGWYIEPSYKFIDEVGIFARYNRWDNAAGDEGGDSEYVQWDLGLNYWPHPNVVLKADYMIQEAPDGKNEFEGFNLGLGYMF